MSREPMLSGVPVAAEFDLKELTTPLLHHRLGIPEVTSVVCRIDNTMFNSYLPDEMTFDHGLLWGTDCRWQARIQFRLGFATA